jgi:hypothetical protein
MTKLPPLCRYCGKPVPKYTTAKWLELNPESMKYMVGSKVLVEQLPKTKAEAQKLFNEEVVSVQRKKEYDWGGPGHGKDLGIGRVTLWDGEAYMDEFFCNGDHARRFAYVMARDGQMTVAFQKAARARDGSAVPLLTQSRKETVK